MDNENKVDDISKFLDKILAGDYDDHLFIINETVSTRKIMRLTESRAAKFLQQE